MEKKPWKFLDTKNGEKVKVDAEDYDRCANHSWRVIETGKHKKKTVITSIRTGSKVRTMSLGQFLMNPDKGLFVFPRRWQRGLDYRKQNLIVCTMQERQRLLPKRAGGNNTSRFKGVSYLSSTKKWRARIEVEGKTIFIGDYDSEEKAARAYNKAAREHFGSDAYCNPVVSRKDRRK